MSGIFFGWEKTRFCRYTRNFVFEVERILRAKRPQGFILENVEGLVNHDGGRTLDVIISKLLDLGYKVEYKVLNSTQFGVPQERKRIYIVGTFVEKPNLEQFPVATKTVGDVLEFGRPTVDSPFVKLLLQHFKIEELYGKSIKDKRGGDTNIHSWDIETKGRFPKNRKNC